MNIKETISTMGTDRYQLIFGIINTWIDDKGLDRDEKLTRKDLNDLISELLDKELLDV